MKKFYNLTPEELSFTMCFTGTQKLPGIAFDPESFLDDNLVENAAGSLKEKEYAVKSEEGKYKLDDGLSFLFYVLNNPYGYFVTEYENKRTDSLVFLNDSIVLLTSNEENFEIMWLPFLPYAIGHTANSLAPFMNENTSSVTLTSDSYEAEVCRLTENGYTNSCTFAAFSNEQGDYVPHGAVLKNENEQIMLIEADGKLCAVKPDKADLVNTLTKLFAPIHSAAIKNSEVLNGNY